MHCLPQYSTMCHKCRSQYDERTTDGDICEKCENGDFKVDRVFESTLKGVEMAHFRVWNSEINEKTKYSFGAIDKEKWVAWVTKMYTNEVIEKLVNK